MNKDEIRLMASTCANYYSCALCPYNPEDISRFIGDRWKGGCPNYDRKLVYAMGKGYGEVSEYKAEIERLKADYAKLQTNAEILARGVRDLNHENYELTEKMKQAQIDVLNKVKNYIDDKIENDYGDMSDSVNYLTIDIDDFDDFIDELIEEVAE